MIDGIHLTDEGVRLYNEVAAQVIEPQHSVTGIDLSDLSTYDPDRDHYGCMELRDKYNDGDYYKVDDVKAALARATPQHPRPTDDHLWDETLRDRDANAEWADKLAGAIAIHFGVDIGEHSNMNLPWSEALDAIESAPPPAAADAVTPQHSVTEQADWPAGYAAWLRNTSKPPFDNDQRPPADAFKAGAEWAFDRPLASTAATQPEQSSALTLPGCLADRLYEAIGIARDRASRAGSVVRMKKWDDTAADLRAALAIPASTAAEHYSQDPSCSCPSGNGSLRWPCPVHGKGGKQNG